MLSFYSYIQLNDFFFLLPEVCLLTSVLHCLLSIAKFNLQASKSLAINKQNITITVLKLVLIYLQIGLLVISLLFFQAGMGDNLINHDFYNTIDDNVFILNHHLIFDGYSLFFKFILLFVVRLLLKASVTYILNHVKALLEFAILIQLFIFFIIILVSANDLVVAFISIIGFSLNTYVLILTDSINHSSREAAIKYYYLSAISSGLIAFSIWLSYLLFLSTNFTEISWILQIWDFTKHVGILSVFVYFLIFGFFFKLAAFPCHLWTADVYEGSPQTIIGLFVLPIKIAVLAFVFKIFLFTFRDLYFIWSFIFWVSSIASMLCGAFYALVEKRIRKFLAYSSINQMGFLLAGITCGVVQTTEAAIIFLNIYIFMNLGLFIILLNTNNIYTNRPLLYITDFHFFAKNNAVYSIAIAIILFSMAGIPPLAGFFGKYFLFLTIFTYKYYTIVIIGLFSSLVSTFYYLRIIKWLWFEQIKTNSKFYTSLSKNVKFSMLVILFILTTYIFFINNWLYGTFDGLLHII